MPNISRRRLDPDLVSEGVVSYKPVSGDVTFQLKVFGSDQSIAYGKLRVLDATSSPSVSESKPVLDLNNPTPPPPAESEATKYSPPTQPITQGPQITRNAEFTGRGSRPSNIPASNPSSAATSPSLANNGNSNPEPAKTAQTPNQTTGQQPQPVQQSATDQPAPLTSASKPTTVARPTTSYPTPSQTSKTAINGWDPNPTDNKPTSNAQRRTKTLRPTRKRWISSDRKFFCKSCQTRAV